MSQALGDRISVALGPRSYDITIRPGLTKNIGQILQGLGYTEKVAVITDRNLASSHLPSLVRSLRAAQFLPTAVVLPPGERTKTLRSVAHVIDQLVTHNFERSSVLIGFGGGVIGDLAGFAAAIYLRGIPFVQVPTTLVAQVDSSVGGKTGVDHPHGKNLIGAFHQPRAVLIDPLTLRTLPKRQWVAGLAEVIKYGVIADEHFFSFLEENMNRLLSFDERSVVYAIKRSCEIKAQVVSEDERETDRRRILNFGHTIGHALEALSGYRGLIHGEAVGIGMVQEADLARAMGLCDARPVTRIQRLIEAAGLTGVLPRVSFAKLWGAMRHDKKVAQGKIYGVWPRGIGDVMIAPLERGVCREWFRVRQRAWPDGSKATSSKGA